jgi:MFS family permease
MAELRSQQDILALLDNAPLGPKHYWLWCLACGGTLLDGMSIFVLGVAMPLVVDEMGIGPSTMGLIGAAIVLGAVAGATVGGPAADRFGRQRLMLLDMVLIAAGGMLSAVARGPVALFVGQFLIGVGIGIDFPVGAAYVSEWMPARNRGRMMVAMIACQSCGMLAAAAVSLVAIRTVGSPDAWHSLLAVVGASAVPFFFTRLFLPESVRWLMSQGRNTDAAAALLRILPADKAAVESLTTTNGPIHHVALVERCDPPPGVGTLFRREYLTRTVLVSVPWFLMDVATYGVGLFTPVILGAIHFSGHAPGPVAADLADARGSGAIDLFLLVGFLVGLWAVPRFGRIRMQIVGFAGMAAGMLILLAATQLAESDAAHVPLVFAGFILFNLLMNAGPNATTFTLAPELFPTQLRASAGGFAAGIAKIGATLGVFVLPIIKSHWGVPAVLGLMAGVSLLGLAVTALSAMRIDEGRSLEARQRTPVAKSI